MKIGIIGSGLVGSTAAYALLERGIGREIVLVDKNEKRAEAEAHDLLHAAPFANPLRISSGDYSSLKDSRMVIISAGVSQKPGESRLELLKRNASVFRDVVPNVLDNAPDAVLVVATNPLDIMTHLAARYAAERGVPKTKVLGAGTMLDTARFRSLLGAHIGIDPQHVHAYVIGEHGDSEVLTWSLATVGGMPLERIAAQVGVEFDEKVRQSIDSGVRNAAYKIIEGKGATYYGVGSALAKVADVLLHDQRSILTVSSPTDEVAGVSDVSVSLPRLIGGEGILETFPLPLEEGEMKALSKSAAIIKRTIEDMDR